MAVEKYLLEDGSGNYLLESSDAPPPPVAFNNFLFVKVGDGMSCTEKIR